MYRSDRISLASEMLGGRMSRRGVLLRGVALAASTPAVSSLLAACGGGDGDTPTEPDDAGASTGAEATPTESDDAGASTDAEATPTESDDAGASTDAEATEEDVEDVAAGETAVVRLGGEIVNLDYHHSGGNQDTILSMNIYSRLVFPQITAEGTLGELIPDLATRWEVSDDGLEYVFHLREGVAWHGDEYGELTASDVVWTLNRIRDPEEASQWAADYVSVTDITQEDDYAVTITLDTPDPMFPYIALGKTGFIMNQQALEDKGEAYSTEPVGTGPYTFESWTRGESCQLTRNNDHWLHQDGNVEQATFRFIPKDTTARTGLEAGELDMSYVEIPQIQNSLIENPDLDVQVQAATRTHWIAFGDVPSDHILRDLKFRRALSLAIDRQLLVDEALVGRATPAHTLSNPNLYGFTDENFANFVYDPDTARDLLEETDYDGTELEIISHVTGVYADIAVVCQGFWQEVGINVTTTALERALLFEREYNGDFQLISGGTARAFPEQMILTHFTSAGIPNRNPFAYTGSDEIADRIRQAQDLDRRAELFIEMQQQMAEDIPAIPLVYPDISYVAQQHVQSSFTPRIAYLPLWFTSVGN